MTLAGVSLAAWFIAGIFVILAISATIYEVSEVLCGDWQWSGAVSQRAGLARHMG
jgi:hypothetical protein